MVPGPSRPLPSAKAARTAFLGDLSVHQSHSSGPCPVVGLWFGPLDIFVPNTQKIKGRKCSVPVPTLGVAGPHRFNRESLGS